MNIQDSRFNHNSYNVCSTDMLKLQKDGLQLLEYIMNLSGKETDKTKAIYEAAAETAIKMLHFKLNEIGGQSFQTHTVSIWTTRIRLIVIQMLILQKEYVKAAGELYEVFTAITTMSREDFLFMNTVLSNVLTTKEYEI